MQHGIQRCRAANQFAGWVRPTAWFSASLAGCATPGAVPTLAVRALAVLHQHASATAPDQERGHGLDLALMLQVSFAARRPRRVRGTAPFETPTSLWSGTVPCTDEALCLWADAAEQSTLVALGVPP